VSGLALNVARQQPCHWRAHQTVSLRATDSAVAIATGRWVASEQSASTLSRRGLSPGGR